MHDVTDHSAPELDLDSLQASSTFVSLFGAEYWLQLLLLIRHESKGVSSKTTLKEEVTDWMMGNTM